MALRLVVILFIIPTTLAWYQTEDVGKAFSCHCGLRDEFRPPTDPPAPMTEPPTSTTTEALPTPPPPPPPVVSPAAQNLPTRFWSIYNSQYRPDGKTDVLSANFLDRVLSVFRRRSTTPPPPFVRLQMDATRDAKEAIASLGRRIVTKYLGRLRTDWNVLDRFNCQCEGDFLDIFQSRNFVSLSIFHD